MRAAERVFSAIVELASRVRYIELCFHFREVFASARRAFTIFRSPDIDYFDEVMDIRRAPLYDTRARATALLLKQRRVSRPLPSFFSS